MLQLRVAGAQRCVCLLGALHRAGTGLHQAVVAGLLLPRELQIGFGGGDIGRALLDDRLLQGDLRVEIAHRRFSRGDVCLGLAERGAKIAIVDLRQQLAGRHRLVVVDQHLRDVAGDLRRDDRRVGFDIGVVGRLQVAAGGEVVVAEIGGRSDAERGGQRQRCTLDRLPRRAKAGFGFLLGSIGKCRHGVLRNL